MVPLAGIPWHDPKTYTPFMISILRRPPLEIYPGSRYCKWPDLSESTRWSSLVPGHTYIVAAKCDRVLAWDDDDDTVHTDIWATAILQFVGYVRVSDDMYLERKGRIDVQEQQQKDRGFEYGVEFDQEDEFVNMRLMAWWVPKFASVSDAQTTFMIDAFSPTTPFPSLSHHPIRVCIHDIRSAMRRDEASDPWAKGVWRDVAAMRIQRAWRAAVASPYTRLGKKRLLEDFQELNAEGGTARGGGGGGKAPRVSV